MNMRYALALAMSLLLLVACSDDYNNACELPDTPSIQQRCAIGDDPDAQPTCVFTLSAECSSNLCVVYNGNGPFCSKDCNTNGDCGPNGICETSPSGQRYCVPADRRGTGL